MESIRPASWHKMSFDEFLHRQLPDLLTRRLHLSGYRAEDTGDNQCCITLQVRSDAGEFEVIYVSIPAPDEAGVFCALDPECGSGAVDHSMDVGVQHYSGGGSELVVVPIADRDDLSAARIACVGDQLYSFIEQRLGHVPDEVELDEQLVRSLAPLDAWVRAFLAQAAQPLNGNNWLDRATHLRRLLIPDREEMFTPGHFGRTCPFETPEGPNIARILTIARGAEVRDGALIVVEDDPVATLGLSASAIPFLEHDDGNRVLMGANMMRQWLLSDEREPALVQTGLEPDAADFWCGRNLLTAYVSWDGYAFEDAVVISASCAAKLACPQPLEPGDKLSNRHGTKGVVGRVLPDDEMPCLGDGTPVELVFSVSGVPSRWNVGQLREAALGRVAHMQGEPAIVPPFQAPSDEELKQRLGDAGVPESGMEVLSDGGESLRRACTVGWVYWGCTYHLARTKLQTVTDPAKGGQRLGRMEVQALCEAGALTVVQELSNTCSAERDDAATLASRVAAAPMEPAQTPSPRFVEVADRLAMAGIQADVDADGLSLHMSTEGRESLVLAQPVSHPWLPDKQLSTVSMAPEADGFQQVAAANARLSHLLDTGAPEPLMAEAREGLTRAVAAFYDRLLSPDDLTCGTRLLFSGRAVLAPGPELSLHQLGLPEEMAWALFSPQVSRELGDSAAVQQRSKAATDALAETLKSSWVILNRAPSVGPTSLLAFQPVLVQEKVLRLHPLACRMLNADFDGDQAAVYLPLSGAAQREAQEKLSIRGHLERDPDLIDQLFPSMDALFGLACLSRSVEGCEEIAAVIGCEPDLEGGILTRDGVVKGLRHLLRQGADVALQAAEDLMRMGFAASRGEGASVGPFVGSSVEVPEPPAGDDVDQWQAYHEEVMRIIALFRDYDDDDVGAVCLLSHSGARGSAFQIAHLIAAPGVVHDVCGRLTPIRHGWRQGLTPAEAFARVVGARKGLYAVNSQFGALGEEHDARSRPAGHGVLSRARRANRPGVVFARAALQGEVDPLIDEYARLFVGLPRADG
jgi:hypothetical protein